MPEGAAIGMRRICVFCGASKGDRIDYWISKGAQPSESVGRLLKRARREAAAAE